MKLHTKIFTALVCCLGFSFYICAGNLLNAHEPEDILFSIVEKNDRHYINYNNIEIDPQEADALLVINGIINTDFYPVIQEGRSLIPIRAVSDAMGFSLEWDNVTRAATIKQDGIEVVIPIDSETALLSGEEVLLDVPAQIINSYTYVPARFITDSFHCLIGFDTNIFYFDYPSNSGLKTKLPVVSIETEPEKLNTGFTSEQATALTKETVLKMLNETYANEKSSDDLKLFLDSIVFKPATESMGRFYRTQIDFYQGWNKLFVAYIFIDRTTEKIYVSDHQSGISEDIKKLITGKYEYYLPIENSKVTVQPFSSVNLLGNAPFLYVNFPENIYSNALSETYYYQTENFSGSARIFISHKNNALQNIDYIIRFENKLGQPVSLSKTMDIAVHGDEEFPDKVIRDHMYRHYVALSTGVKEDIVIEPGQLYDIAIKDLTNDQFFTGMIDFTASSNLTITVFAVNSSARKEEIIIPSASEENPISEETAGEENDETADSTDITDEPTVTQLIKYSYSHIKTPTINYDFSYSPQTYTLPANDNIDDWDTYYTTYSGTGKSYRLGAAATLKASEMAKSATGSTAHSIAFESGGSANNINERHGIHEIIEIELLEPRGANNEITKAVWHQNAKPEGYVPADGDRFDKDIMMNYGNLGNWGVEYEMAVTLINDTDTDKVFTCGIVPTHQSSWLIINDIIYAANLNNRPYSETINRSIGAMVDTIHLGSGIKSDVVDRIFVPANTTKTYTYGFVLGTESNSSIYHVWSCVEAEY